MIAGLNGDLRITTGSIFSNSFNLEGSGATSTDVGKRVFVLGAGLFSEDLVTAIVTVAGDTAILAARASNTVELARTKIWTDNADVLNTALAYAGAVLEIPRGRFGVMGSNYLDSTSAYIASLFVTTNNLRIIGSGHGPDGTVLDFIGAWRRVNGFVRRGDGIWMIGNLQNITFENMELDGGVENGYTTNSTWPASIVNGDGWDLSHKAIVAGRLGTGPAGGVTDNITFRNVHFHDFRGEQVYHGTVCGRWNFINCVFERSNASLLNPAAICRVSDCVFGSATMPVEFNQSSGGLSTFTGCTFTNFTKGITFVQANSNNISPVVLMGNHFSNIREGAALRGANAKLVTAIGNVFTPPLYAAWETESSGGQGNEWMCSMIKFTGNNIYSDNVGYGGILLAGAIRDSDFSGNTFVGVKYPLGYYGTITNVIFGNNLLSGCQTSFVALSVVDGGPTITNNVLMNGTPP